jgi:hypothetical protein
VRARAILPLAALLVAGAACRSASPVLVRVDMPGVSPFAAGSFPEIVVTNFRNEAPIPDFDAGLEIQTTLAAALRHAFPGTVSLRPLPAVDAATPSFWREAAAGSDRPIFLTGSVRLVSQVRKAAQGKRILVDSPFNLARRALIEQLRWTLLVDLVVISGESGEILYAKSFREDRDYIDLEKPADFAFSDLSAVFLDRLLPALLGTTTIEERSLLRR